MFKFMFMFKWGAAKRDVPSSGLDRAQLDVADLQREGLLGHAQEAVAAVGEGDVQFAELLLVGGQFFFCQQFLHRRGAVVGGVDEGDFRSGEALDCLA